jgi:hypothetical protein
MPPEIISAIAFILVSQLLVQTERESHFFSSEQKLSLCKNGGFSVSGAEENAFNASKIKVFADMTVGQPTEITGTPSVLKLSVFLLLFTPEPGEIPLSVT